MGELFWVYKKILLPTSHPTSNENMNKCQIICAAFLKTDTTPVPRYLWEGTSSRLSHSSAVVIIPIPQSMWWRVPHTCWEKPDKELSLSLPGLMLNAGFGSKNCAGATGEELAPQILMLISGAHTCQDGIKQKEHPVYNSAWCTLENRIRESNIPELLVSNAFGQCFGNQRANFIWPIVLFLKKFLEECSADLFDVTELFSLMLYVEAMHNLSAGRILGCPFVFQLI